MITGKELEEIANNKKWWCYGWQYDWQAIANELDQRQDNEIQRLCEELRNAQTPYEHIATGTSVTFPNQRTCETCKIKYKCRIYLMMHHDEEFAWFMKGFTSCSLYTKEGYK